MATMPRSWNGESGSSSTGRPCCTPRRSSPTISSRSPDRATWTSAPSISTPSATWSCWTRRPAACIPSDSRRTSRAQSRSRPLSGRAGPFSTARGTVWPARSGRSSDLRAGFSGRDSRASGSLSDQALVFRPDEPVALAGGLLQALAVQDTDPAAAVFDEVPALEQPRGLGHAGAPHAEHLRQEFLRQRELIARHAVVRHQEPSRASLSYGMDPVAGGGLPDLGQQGLSVAPDGVSQSGARP